jgi:hypothetical protein
MHGKDGEEDEGISLFDSHIPFGNFAIYQFTATEVFIPTTYKYNLHFPFLSSCVPKRYLPLRIPSLFLIERYLLTYNKISNKHYNKVKYTAIG